MMNARFPTTHPYITYLSQPFVCSIDSNSRSITDYLFHFCTELLRSEIDSNFLFYPPLEGSIIKFIMADKQKAQQRALETKVQQLLEELSKREAHVRAEEAKLSHLEKYALELQDKAAALSRREEAMLQWEVKQSKALPRPPSISQQSFRSEQGDIMGGDSHPEGGQPPKGPGGSWIGGVSMNLLIREEQTRGEEARVRALQEALLQQRQEFAIERADFDRKVAESEEEISRQRDDLRKRVATHQKEVESFALREEEKKIRDEENDVNARLVHDLEMSEKNARRGLLQVQEEYYSKMANLDVERDAFEAESEELRLQWKEYDRRKKDFEAAGVEAAEEMARLHRWQSALVERERELRGLAEQLEEQKQSQLHLGRQQHAEHQEITAHVRRNEVLAREAEIDAARAEDFNRRATLTNKETAKLQQVHDTQRIYLEDWEAELQGREDEMARLIEFVVGIPKTHKSTEIQSMNAGLLQLQQKRLNENYASGQRRRVQSATATRFGGGSRSGGASAAGAGGGSGFGYRLSSSVFASRLPPSTTKKSKRPTSPHTPLSSRSISPVGSTGAADSPIVAATTHPRPLSGAVPLSHGKMSRPPTSTSHKATGVDTSIVPRLLRPMTAISVATSNRSGGFSTRVRTTDPSAPVPFKAIESGIEAESRIVTLLRAIDARKRRFNGLAARAKLLNKDRDESAVDAFFMKLTPSQRLDVEVAIHRERDFASEVGLRQRVMQCPYGIGPSAEPKVQVQRIAKWWGQLGDHLVATDERSLQTRMEVLERAVSALRSAHDRARCTEDGEVLADQPTPIENRAAAYSEHADSESSQDDIPELVADVEEPVTERDMEPSSASSSSSSSSSSSRSPSASRSRSAEMEGLTLKDNSVRADSPRPSSSRRSSSSVSYSDSYASSPKSSPSQPHD